MKKKQNIIDIEWVVDHRSDGFYIRKTEEFVFSSDYKVHLQENGQNIDVMFTYRNAVGKMNGDFSITIARCTNRAEARNAAMEFLKTFKTALSFVNFTMFPPEALPINNCEYCKSKRTLVVNPVDNVFQVLCGNCGAQGQQKNDEESAKKSWNRINKKCNS